VVNLLPVTERDLCAGGKKEGWRGKESGGGGVELKGVVRSAAPSIRGGGGRALRYSMEVSGNHYILQLELDGGVRTKEGKAMAL